MCGITFYFNRNGISAGQLKESLQGLNALRHRGPDGEGVVLINVKTGKFFRIQTPETPQGTPEAIQQGEYQDGEAHIFFGHRRLSIFDLSVAGHQPMSDEAGNWIIFNGEIYNFHELREELKQKGHLFRTATDTEVILASYREWGIDCLRKFNGMWALVLWDANQKKIYLANDRFGVKGLYTHQNENEFIAASEIKSLLFFKGRKGDFNYPAIEQFLENGFLDYDLSTFFEKIHRFPPSFAGIINPAEGTDVKLIRHWEQPLPETGKFSNETWIEKFREVLYSATRLRMRSDAPWGVSLSGGLDSSSLVCAASELLKKEPGLAPGLETFSCIFPGKFGDESSFIQIVEKAVGISGNHVQPMDLFSIEELTRQIWHQDFPVQTTAMFAEWCLMKLTRNNHIKVLLTGSGGDELLAGYHHHFYRYLRQLLMRFRFGTYKKELKAFASLKDVSEKSLRQIAWGEVKQFLPYRFGKKPKTSTELRHSKGTLEETLRHDFTSVMLPTYIRSEDRDSMAFGVETRSPFLDYRMVDLAMTMPAGLKIRNGWQKWILRQGMTELPPEIRWRKDKKGYSNPQQEWIHKHADGFLDNLDEIGKLGIPVDKDETRKALLSKDNEKSFRLSSLSLWLKTIRDF